VPRAPLRGCNGWRQPKMGWNQDTICRTSKRLPASVGVVLFSRSLKIARQRGAVFLSFVPSDCKVEFCQIRLSGAMVT